MSANAQIPPGQEGLVQRMLETHPIADRCRAIVRSVAITESFIRATYTLPEGRMATVHLRHPGDVPTATARTAKFAIEVTADLPDEARALTEALSHRIRLNEASFLWSAAEGVEDDASNLELFALVRGLKPAVRTHLNAADQAHAVRRYQRLGFAVEVRPDRRDATHAFVYVARARSIVLRLAELEVTQTRDAQRELGHMLGYPACCIDAFLARDEAPDRSVDELFRAVRAATVASPYFRLNTVLAAEERTYASFYPCRFDCPHAARLVDTFAAALDPKTRADVDAALRVAVAVSCQGARYRVRLERGDDVIVRHLDALPPAEAAATLFADRVVTEGLVRIDGANELAVIDFAWAQ